MAVAASLMIGALAPAVSAGAPEDPGAQGRIVRKGNMSVVVPPAGQAVHFELYYGDGASRVLSVEHRRDGSLHTRYEGPETAHEPYDESKELLTTTTVTYLSPCDTSLYKLIPNMKVVNPLYFLFNDDVMVDGVTAAEAKSALTNGAANVATARNDCGFADNVDAPLLSGTGDTSLRTNFYIEADGDHQCGAMDVYSVFEFGQLKDALASVCWTNWSNGEVMTADIRFDKNRNWFTGASPCSNDVASDVKRWDLQGTSTHEMGHVYGLAHNLYESDPFSEQLKHAKATMHAVALQSQGRCNTAYRTLGKGDILGLEAKY